MRLVTYLINMAESANRLESVQGQFASAALPFVRIDAVDGRKLTDQQISEAYSPFGAAWRVGRQLTRGEIGCGLSHQIAYHSLLESHFDAALICEDDILISRDLQSVIRSICDVETGWSVVSLCRLFDNGTPCACSPISGVPEYSLCSYDRTVWGTQAYIVSRTAAARLTRRRISVPADNLIFVDEAAHLKPLVVEPNPVEHAEIESARVARSEVPPLALSRQMVLRMIGQAGAAGRRLRRWRVRRSSRRRTPRSDAQGTQFQN